MVALREGPGASGSATDNRCNKISACDRTSALTFNYFKSSAYLLSYYLVILIVYVLFSSSPPPPKKKKNHVLTTISSQIHLIDFQEI